MALPTDIRTLEFEIADIDRELLSMKNSPAERTVESMRKFSRLVAGRKRRLAKVKQLHQEERELYQQAYQHQATHEEFRRPSTEAKGWDHLYTQA